jgi:hypothetical protein
VISSPSVDNCDFDPPPPPPINDIDEIDPPAPRKSTPFDPDGEDGYLGRETPHPPSDSEEDEAPLPGSGDNPPSIDLELQSTSGSIQNYYDLLLLLSSFGPVPGGACYALPPDQKFSKLAIANEPAQAHSFFYC